jgi:hypothetical protein
MPTRTRKKSRTNRLAGAFRAILPYSCRSLWCILCFIMELEQATTPFQDVDDLRPRLLAPPPVQLVAIADVSLTAVVGLESELDEFYGGLLGLQREAVPPQLAGHRLTYRSANFRLHIELAEKPVTRHTLRPLSAVVPSLIELAGRLAEAQRPFVRQRGLAPGSESISLYDPAGNLVEVTESRIIV